MRLAAQAKGGFYPTPDGVVDMIADMIGAAPGYYHHDQETLRILDPCCGAGDAIDRLANRIHRSNAVPVETYGVELHRERSQKARQRLHRVLATDLFRTAIANGAFSVLYLNPPYDFDGEQKRTEHAFLTYTTRYLAERGLLVFIVPRRRLAVSARYLSTHYGGIRCWAFPQPEREVFDQVVLMGHRKEDPSPDPYAEGRIREWAFGEPESLRFHRSHNASGGDPLWHPYRGPHGRRFGGPPVWALDQHGDHRHPLARHGHPHPPSDAPAQGTHGHAGGGRLPRQPLPGGRW